MAQRSVAKGVAAGIAGGLVASWTMNQFQAAWSTVVADYRSPSAGGKEDARDWQERSEGINATEIAAQHVATRTIERRLTRDELSVAAPLVHYGFGAAMGALYGGVAAVTPAVRACAGTGYGTAVWVGADEIAMPLLGLADPEADRPVEMHAQAFAAHLVYGLTLELVWRALRYFFAIAAVQISSCSRVIGPSGCSRASRYFHCSRSCRYCSRESSVP
jgi:putative membrane protein